MGPKRKYDDLARESSAGTGSGDGGGGGGGDASPPAPKRLPLSPPRLPLSPPSTSPSRDARALPTSPPLLQPPPPPPPAADRDTGGGLDNGDVREEENDKVEDDEDGGLDNGDLREEENDKVEDDEDEGPYDDYMPEEEDAGDWNWEQEEAVYNYGDLEEGEIEDDADSGEQEREVGDDQDQAGNLRGSSDSEFFCIFMSDRRNVPDDIIRNGFIPLNKHAYFSLYQFWSQLLGNYRSYHQPRKDHRAVNGGFRCPVDRPVVLGIQEPLSELIRQSSGNYIIQEKIKILSKQYGLLRRTRSDGSCFYRALMFSYLENLGQMQDRQAEVIRLMECVEVSTNRFLRLQWEEAYFLNPKEYFSSVADELYYLVDSVANGLTSEKLYERSLEETLSGRIISFLRLLTEVEIRTRSMYKPFIPKDRLRKKIIAEDMIALKFCWKQVRNLDAEADTLQMRALTYALGIPLRVEIVDRKSKKGEPVRVKRLDFFHQSDLNKGPFHLVQSYYSSSTAHKPLERGNGNNLLSSDGAPLLTLLCRHGRCDILYRK